MPDNIIEKYLDYDGLKTYDSNIKEVLQKDITESAWQPSHAYVEDDYVVYNGLLYQCTNAHTSGTPTTPAEWEASEASYWQQIHILDDEITPLKTAVDTITPIVNSAVQTVSGTSPVSVTISGTTRTVSLANGYGDTKNPYGAKSPNTVLAGPSSGTTSSAPTFRKLVAADIPDLSGTYIPKTAFGAKGDLLVGTGDDSYVNMGTGSNGQVLMVDSTIPTTGVKWATIETTDTTYTFAEGTTSGAFQVTPSTTGATTQTVSIHGLGNAAYKGVATTVSSSSTDDDLATAKAVYGAIGNGTITIQKNSTTVSSFTTNQTASATINIDDVASAATLSTTVSRVTDIEGVIPTEATTSNKLADKSWVNDQINAMAAYYITKNAAGDAFATVAELTTTSTVYSGGAVRVPTRNDYAIVLADENHDGATTRYSYQHDGSTYDTQYWQYQYTVNESPFTQEQLDAINSGITSDKVSTYDGYATSKQATLVSGTNIKAINTTLSTAQSTASSETLLGSGTLNLHKIAKTGTYSDLINRPTVKYGSNTANTISALEFAAGTNITLTQDGSNNQKVTISATDTGATTLSGNTAESGKAITAASYNATNRTITFTKSEFVTPSTLSTTVSNMVTTTSTLSADYLVLGNGNKTVAASTVSISDLALTDDLPEVEFSTDPYTTPTATIKGMKVGDDEYNFFIPDSIAAATTDVLGSVKLGTASAGTATKTYPVGFNASQQMYVDVPWTDTTSFTITANATDGIFDITGTNGTNAVTYALAPYSSGTASSTWVNNDTNAGKFYLGTQNPSKTTRLNYNGYLYAKNLYDNGSRVVNLADAQTLTGVKTWNVSSGTTAGVIVNNSAWSTPGSSQSGLTPTGIQITYGLNNYNLSFPTTKGGIFALTNDIPYVNMTYTAGTSGSANTTTWSYRAAGATGDPLTVTFNNITTAEINALFN